MVKIAKVSHNFLDIDKNVKGRNSKMKKKTKVKLIIVCTLLLTLCLAGCGLFKSDTQKLTELLEDKYGEEFGVESYYYAGDMWAMCYPVSDPTLLFEVRTDGEVTKISHDYYLQNVVARQVEEEYGPLVEQAFPGSYLSVDISHTLSSIPENFPMADTVTLDDIMKYYSENGISSDIVLNIFVDTSQMSEENIENEYKFLYEVIGSRVKNGELPDTVVDLYFGDAMFVQECKNAIAEETWRGNSEIYNKIEDCPKSWMGYGDNGEACFTLEEYIEMRTEALNNEQ